MAFGFPKVFFICLILLSHVTSMPFFVSNFTDLTFLQNLLSFVGIYNNREDKCKMTNAENTSLDNNTSNYMTLTANEVTNVLGENYKTVAKMLNSLAAQGKIKVTEKTVNNRVLKGFILSIADLQSIKDNFQKGKNLQSDKNAPYIQMLANAITTSENTENEEKSKDDISIKFYEEKSRNLELTRELEKLKAELSTKTNENVRLDADLTVAKSELKYITDKSTTMESAWAEEKQKTAQLEKGIKSRNIAIIILGAILLIIFAVATTLYLVRHI